MLLSPASLARYFQPLQAFCPRLLVHLALSPVQNCDDNQSVSDSLASRLQMIVLMLVEAVRLIDALTVP